jgi:hypothetical protein
MTSKSEGSSFTQSRDVETRELDADGAWSSVPWSTPVVS